jgi:putative ABC transport system permease protein
MSTNRRIIKGSSIQPLLALRLAMKGLQRSPSTTLLAAAILALGLAAPTTFFSILVGALRPLPVPEGARVVRVDVVQPQLAGAPLAVLPEDLVGLGHPESLEALGGFRIALATIVDPGLAATRISLAEMTPEAFSLLRVQPQLGRIPRADEAGLALVLGHDVWQETYEGDPGVLGRSVEMNDRAVTIVGIMPHGFGFPFNQNAWVSLDASAASSDPIELVGRLSDSATEVSATTEMALRWAQADETRDVERRDAVLEVAPFTGGRGEAGEAVAFIGLVLVALSLLLIACANVANLLLVRATERIRALSIQSAIGASRGQISVQLLLEALLVAAVGGLAGLLLAGVGVDALQRSLASEHFGYHWMRLAIDGRVLTFTGVLVVGTALVAGMIPAIRVLGIDVQRVLKEEGSGSTLGGGGFWSRSFVTAQLSLSCGALVAAGLAGQALNGARDFGGDLPTEEILIAAVDLGAESPEARQITLDELEGRLVALPGVATASIALGAPGYFEPYGSVEMDGAVVVEGERRERVNWNAVTTGYFAALDLDLLAGRSFGAEDRGASTPVAVVNESFVRRHSPDRDVLGRAVRVSSRPDSLVWHTIVGVVSDAVFGQGDRVRHDRVYLPLSQVQGASALVLLRARSDAPSLSSGLREAVAGVDPDMAVWSVRTLADGHAFMTRIPRTIGALAFGGGIAGLLVAAVGLYGLLSFRVRQRRREFGIRLALGADGGRLALDTVDFALRQLLPAVVIGLTLAWIAAPILAVLLLGLNPRAASTYAAVAAVFLTVGIAAAALPAWRASLTNPATVLRGD